MGIILYIMENMIFPLLVATLEIYIIRYIDKKKQKQVKYKAVGTNYCLFLS